MKLRSADKQPVFQQAVYTPSWPKSVQEFSPAFFDESSHAWRKNKIEVVKGSYKYKKEEVVEPRKSPRIAEQQKRKAVETLRRSPRFQ